MSLPPAELSPIAVSASEPDVEVEIPVADVVQRSQAIEAYLVTLAEYFGEAGFEQSISELESRLAAAGAVLIDSFTITGGDYFERGSNPTPTLNWEISGSGTVSEIRIGSTVLDSADRTWTDVAIDDDTTYTLTVVDAEAREVTAIVTAIRSLPVYFGAANPADPDDMTSQEAQDLTGLRLGSELQGSYEISTIGTQYVYLVAPSSFAAPVRVRVNGFDVADPFVSDTKGLTTAYGVDANYIFYRLELPYTDTTLILEID
ncbi:MAG: hypothetical protein ABJO67_16255 [Pseudoruegeria sp.]